MESSLKQRDPLRATLFMFAWAMSFVGAMSLVKFLSSDISNVMLVFLRLLFGVIFVVPLVLRHGFAPVKTKKAPLHLLRVFLVSLAIAATYYSYRHLPFPIVTTIGFTSPLIVSMLSWIFFKDHMTVSKAFFIILGYIGVLIIASPTSVHFSDALWVALVGNVLTSLAILTLKALTKTESTESILLYTNGVTFLVWLGVAVFNWQTPSGDDLLLLPFIGCLGVLSQYCYIKALQCEEASYVAPFEYLRLVLAVPMGFFVFHESLHFTSMIGAGIIILGSVGLMICEQKQCCSNFKF